MQPSLQGGQIACHFHLNHLSHLAYQSTVQALLFQHFASGKKIRGEREVQNAISSLRPKM